MKFTKKQFIHSVLRHISITDHKGHEIIGPTETNQNIYWEDFKYFCTILQKELKQGKTVVLPGIGEITLVRFKPTGKVTLKIHMPKSLHKYYEGGDV